MEHGQTQAKASAVKVEEKEEKEKAKSLLLQIIHGVKKNLFLVDDLAPFLCVCVCVCVVYCALQAFFIYSMLTAFTIHNVRVAKYSVCMCLCVCHAAMCHHITISFSRLTFIAHRIIILIQYVYKTISL